MDNEKEPIDKLYSEKFEKFEFQATDDDWNHLNRKLVKSNFLKFSFATMNVYVLVVLISFAATAAYFAFKNNFKSHKINYLEQKIDTLQDQINILDSNLLLINTPSAEDLFDTKKLTFEAEKSDTNSKYGLLTKNNNEKTNNSDVPIQKTSLIDSINLKPDSLPALKKDSLVKTKPKTTKIVKVKKTVVVKKENVIITDTVRIKKNVK